MFTGTVPDYATEVKGLLLGGVIGGGPPEGICGSGLVDLMSELLRSGRIGELRLITGHFSYFKTDPDNVRNRVEWGGGGLLDIAVAASFSPTGARAAGTAGNRRRDLPH